MLVVAKVLLERLVDKLVVLPSLARRARLGRRGGPRRAPLADGCHDDALDLLLGLQSRRLAPEGEALCVSFFFSLLLLLKVV